MLSEGNNPEDATKLFNKALERMQLRDFETAERYFGLSIYYEPRPVTFLERAKLCLLREWTKRALADVEKGLKLCSKDEEHVKIRMDLLSLRNVINPLIDVENRTLAEMEQRKSTIRALAVAGKFQEALDFVGLSDCIDDLKVLSLPSLRLNLLQHHDGSVSTKFGEIPDVPPDFEWPVVDCEAVAPLEFLCQLDLSVIATVWPDSGLPSNGILSFFADPSEFSFGGIASSWKVFHFENQSTLMPAQRPSPDPIWDDFPEETFPACSVEFACVNTLPDGCSTTIRSIIMSDEERDKYEELLYGWQGDAHDEPTHQLLGHPQLIQQDVFVDCYEELERFDPKYQKQFVTPSSEPGDPANNWLLLLQIASDDLANFFWGDNGKLYFCIRKGDLDARNFAGVVLIGQCF